MNASLPDPPAAERGWPWQADRTRPSAKVDNDSLPSITVVTPSYNQGQYLEATIRSVLLQDYPRLQYIVVDGGSTDRSHDVLERYSGGIDHLIEEPDDGQSDAICKGIELATGELFGWINSDDMLAPGVLWELARQYADDIDLFTFSVAVEGDGVEPYRMRNEKLSARRILRCDRYSFSQPGLWFRMPYVNAVGGIDRSLNYGFDWDLLIRYLSAYDRVHYSDKVGAIFRLHDQSKTVVESSHEDDDNRFLQETDVIRDKLEQTLSASLASASRLGRQRYPWNERLVEILDDFETSPLISSATIVREAMKSPRARCSTRTLGAIVRILSRYVRGNPRPKQS